LVECKDLPNWYINVWEKSHLERDDQMGIREIVD